MDAHVRRHVKVKAIQIIGKNRCDTPYGVVVVRAAKVVRLKKPIRISPFIIVSLQSICQRPAPVK